MPEYLASEVAFQEEQAAVLPVVPAPATDGGVVMVTERGPFEPTGITSFDEFLRIYGGHVTYSKSALWMKTCFEESGGGKVFVQRTCHFTDPNDPTSKTSTAAELVVVTANNVAAPAQVDGTIPGPFALVPGDTLVFSIDGDPDVTVTFNATAASVESTASDPFVLTDGMVLNVSVSGGAPQPVTFEAGDFLAIGAATAEEVTAVLNAQLSGAKALASSAGAKVTVQSDAKGSGQSLSFAAGAAATALGFSGTTNGTGNVANIGSVGGTEAATLIDTALGADGTASYTGSRLHVASATTGGGSSIQVKPISTANDEFGLNTATHQGIASGTAQTWRIKAKSDGDYGNSIRVKIVQPPSGDTTMRNLQVEFRGKIVESDWVNISSDPASPRYAPRIVNDPYTGSDYIQIEDLSPNLPVQARLPAPGVFGPMTGGGNGLLNLNDQDFLGGSSASGRTGLRVFDVVDTARILACPDRPTPIVNAGLLTYCDVTKEQTCFAIIDLPTGLSAQGVVDYVKVTAAIQRLSGFGAAYWPSHYVANPQREVYGDGDLALVPVSAHVMGATQRNGKRSDTAIWQPAAGIDYGRLVTARKPENDEVLDKVKRKLIFPELINPVHSEGGPVFIDGARTLDDNNPFPTVGERLGINFLKKTMETNLMFIRHSNIKPRLYEQAKNKVDAFMIGQTAGEAFASNRPADAYRLDIGPGLNPPSVKRKRRVLAKLSVATAQPAEFVTMIISPDTRALEAELAAAAG